MTDRLDALAVREVNGKSYWTKLGVAFPAKEGSGWNLLLDAMPAPVDGQFKIMLRPPQDRQQAEAPRQSYSADKAQRRATAAPQFASGADEIPF